MDSLDFFVRLFFVFCICVPIAPSYSSKLVGYVLKLGVVLPYEGDYPWTRKKTRPAIEYAIDRIRNQSDLLPGIVIQIKTGDSKCSETYGPLAAIDFYVNRSVQVFIGPACDYALAPIAAFSPHWNIPIITGGALVNAFKSKRQYRLLTRMSASYGKLGDSVSAFMDHFRWTSVGFLYFDNRKHGNSNTRSECYFTMTDIHDRLKGKFKVKHPTEEMWSEHFDQRITVPGDQEFFDASAVLRRVSLNAKS